MSMIKSAELNRLAERYPHVLERSFWQRYRAPISIGVLPQTGQGELDVPEDLRARLTEGVVLAVSLEPFGGSPTGKATGPVVALGEVRP